MLSTPSAGPQHKAHLAGSARSVVFLLLLSSEILDDFLSSLLCKNEHGIY